MGTKPLAHRWTGGRPGCKQAGVLGATGVPGAQAEEGCWVHLETAPRVSVPAHHTPGSSTEEGHRLVRGEGLSALRSTCCMASVAAHSPLRRSSPGWSGGREEGLAGGALFQARRWSLLHGSAVTQPPGGVNPRLRPPCLTSVSWVPPLSAPQPQEGTTTPWTRMENL